MRILITYLVAATVLLGSSSLSQYQELSGTNLQKQIAGHWSSDDPRIGQLQDSVSKLSDKITQLSLVVSNQNVKLLDSQSPGSTGKPLASERPSGLGILKAVYGVGPTDTVDVTEEVRSLAKSGSIHLHPQWALGIDPAYGKTKRVTIAYRYDGQIEVASFDQFQEFDIPLAPKITLGSTAAAP